MGYECVTLRCGQRSAESEGQHIRFFEAILLKRMPVADGNSGKLIQWTDYAASILLGHVGVDHRGLNVGVPEKLLHGTYVIPRLN